MKLKKFELGPIETNSYVVIQQEKAIIIDTGTLTIAEQLSYIEKEKATLVAIFFTHGHFDHIMALTEILQTFPQIEIYIGEKEREFLTRPELCLATLYEIPLLTSLEGLNITFLKDGDQVSQYGIKAYHMPGHTQGGMVYEIAQISSVIVGDLIFSRGHGRVDLPTSNAHAMEQSLKRFHQLFPQNYRIYSGHGESFLLKEWEH